MDHFIERRRSLVASALCILWGCGGTVPLGNAANETTGGAPSVITTSLGGTTGTGGASNTPASATSGGVNVGGTMASKTSATTGGVFAAGGTVATGGIGATGGRSVASSAQQADASTCTKTDVDCVVRVAKTGNDANGGESWAEALGSVQEGLDVAGSLISEGACCNVEVWVAVGTYTPTDTTDSTDARTATFQLLANVGLFGGFAGTELLRSDRNIAANVTVLSGDIGTPGDTSDNSYHVVMGATGATLDGFTVSGGNANGDSARNEGWVRGGGIYNSDAASTIRNCTFTQNNGSNGAAAYNYRNSPSIANCTFTHNTGNNALFNHGSSAMIASSLFANNSGAGIYSTDSGEPTITNCTIVNNAGTGIVNGCAGMYCNRTPQPDITNCIVWGNGSGAADDQISDPIIVPENGGSTDPLSPRYYSSATVSNSIVQGGYHGEANVITADPRFVDPANGDFRLSTQSPAIDAGNGCADYAALTDLAGNGRWDLASVANAVNAVDIGAFEYQGAAGVDSLITAFDCK